MPESATEVRPLPAVDYLKIPEQGTPYLEGARCTQCNAIFIGARSVCSKCAARDAMTRIRLSETGKLYSFAIVHRSFPGIEVPFISAIVDLDDGATLKGNLVDIEPDPQQISFGLPVRVVYRDALGRKDRDGNSYLSYFFTPA